MLLFYQALSFNGPIAPNTLLPPSDPTTNLAARAPTPILIMSCLLALNAVDKVVNAAAGPSGPIACFTAVPAFAASKNVRPAPVSIKFTENVFLRLERRAFLRLATIGVTPEWGGRRGSRPTHI